MTAPEVGGPQWLAEGFVPWPMAGRFVPAVAKVYYKHDAGRLVFGVDVEARHCNGFKIAHGGFLSTMADIWLGYNVAHALPREARFSTASLTVDFLRAVHCGARIYSTLDRIKLGRRLHHAAGAMLVDGQPVAEMRAMFAAA